MNTTIYASRIFVGLLVGLTFLPLCQPLALHGQLQDPIPAPLPKGSLTVELATLAQGMAAPLGMAAPDDGTGRFFIYDQVGLVRVFDRSQLLSTPLLDVRQRLVNLGATYDERGLLGLETHPDFRNHPLLYTYTSEPASAPPDFMANGGSVDHQSVVAEWRLDAANSNQVDVASRRELLRIDQPQPNHNAGTLRFGPDGYLYIALGDGGGANDTSGGHGSNGNGQNINTVHGSVLRIDVDGTNSANGMYGVPADNPFVGQNGIDEIFAYGFRNPYMFSFDSMTGDLWLGDVGQNEIEEVDRVTKGGNYGWNFKEGSFFFNPSTAGVATDPIRPVPGNLIDPVAEYDHSEGTSVIGGYVYRGTQIKALTGLYVTGDYRRGSSGRLFYLNTNSDLQEFQIGMDDRSLGMQLKGFGEDRQGELYVFGSNGGPSGTSGQMLKIVPLLQLSGIRINGQQLVVAFTGNIPTGTVLELQAKNDLDPQSPWTSAGATFTDLGNGQWEASVALPAVQSTFFRLAQVR